MNRRIKKKKLKQWIKNNVKITYSVERLDNEKGARVWIRSYGG